MQNAKAYIGKAPQSEYFYASAEDWYYYHSNCDDGYLMLIARQNRTLNIYQQFVFYFLMSFSNGTIKLYNLSHP